MPSYDVIVIGLGAMGSATVWQLARRGLRVLGIDRYAPPHHLGSSHGRSRIIRQAYFEHPLYVPLVQHAWSLWEELSASSGERLLARTGGLMIGPADGTLIGGTAESARVHGLACERWSAADVRARVPALRVPDTHVALFERQAGVLRPERAIDAMLTLARRDGAELAFDTEVTGWRADGGGYVVATPARDVCTARLVLAAGPWAVALLPGVRAPLTVERAVQCWFRPAAHRESFGPERLPVFIVEGTGGRFFYGLPDEGEGVKLAEHRGGETTTADGVKRVVGDDDRDRVAAIAREWLPALEEQPSDASVCLYTNTPDGHFILDTLPGHPGAIVASPCSGHGFKFAPAIGETLADLATGTRPRFDLTPFRLSRF